MGKAQSRPPQSRDFVGAEDGNDDVALVFDERFAEADLGVLEAAVNADDALDGRG